ncbi:hypothetical protein VaNZ11_010544 [Volvox africanus]|uniref:F-box domain-containing protein n=1 Tax=Volvox africanus TaxID=51714 RepID=A0ABQ5SB00_9CHLO|nr:hypothetical protein VaNZ11_010544 [Volvox africanus]
MEGFEHVSSERASAPGLADPAPALVENLCAQFVFDGDSLLRLGQINRVWRGTVNDVALWERLNTVRFCPSAISSARVLAQPATAIPGWCFFAGLDSAGGDCATPKDANGNLHPTDLASRAERLGAIAFNTQGWIKNGLQAKSQWNRYSYVPGVGMYVREDAVGRILGAPLPAPLPKMAEPQVRPPDFPGWVFYSLMDSPGGDIRHPANGDTDFTSTCSTLEELAEVASRLPSCVAFNTSGSLKHRLQPQVHWRQGGSSCNWGGLYVRQDVVEAKKLRKPTEDGRLDPCLHYFQLGKTRLLAARDVDVTWLNNTYLMRIPDPAPARAAAAATTDPDGGAPEPVEVVKLSHVCWLELTGRFNGVGPGRYHCVWVLRLARSCNVAELKFSITLRAARQLCTGPLAASAEVVHSGKDSVPGDEISSGDIPALGTVLGELVVAGQELRGLVGLGWYGQHAGSFRVPPGAVYDVEVRLWNHDSTWKGGLLFKELLIKCVEGAQEQEPPTAAQDQFLGERVGEGEDDNGGSEDDDGEEEVHEDSSDWDAAWGPGSD